MRQESIIRSRSKIPFEYVEEKKRYQVNWDRTVENVRFRLHGHANARTLTDLLGVSEKNIQAKLQVPNKVRFTISELTMLARFLGCTLMDLVVFESDPYVRPSDEVLTLPEPAELTNSKDVTKFVRFREELDESTEIRDIYELLLYLPLIDAYKLHDIVFRCSGNLLDSRDYVKEQLNYLYRTIRRSPAKDYADAYRGVLRTKGDPYELDKKNDESLLQQYNDALDRYRAGDWI